MAQGLGARGWGLGGARGSTKSPSLQPLLVPSPQLPARALCITMSANDAEGPLRCYRSRLPDHDRVVGASGHAAVAAAIRRRGAKPDVRRCLYVSVVPSPGARDMDERPPQQDDSAGDTGQREGRFLERHGHAQGTPLPLARRQRRILHHRVVPHRQAARAQGRVHARQPPHPAFPDDDRQRLDGDPAAKLGRAAAAVVRQHGDRPAGRARRDAHPVVEQELRRLPRQPAGEQLPAGDANLRDQMDRLRHVVRTVPRARERARARPRRREARRHHRRSAHRPADAARFEVEQHDLRAVPLAARRDRARLHRRRRLLRSFPAAAREPAAEGRRPRLLGRRAAAPLLERRDRPLAEPVLPAGRRDLHQLPPRAPARRRQEPAAGAGEQRALHAVSREDRRGGHRAHAPRRAERRQFLRRVPHAENGDEHQGDDARSHHRPAGAGKHGGVQHPERVHRVPHRPQAGVGG